jgi:Tfp pilus assembly protein PilF
MADEDALAAARKKCMQCGAETELLRFRCPSCASEQFTLTSASPELWEIARGRQQLSQQNVDEGGRLFQQGMVEQAQQKFHQAIEANPFNAIAHGNIGVIFLRRGEPKEATEWFERALEIDPAVPGGREMLEKARSEAG